MMITTQLPNPFLNFFPDYDRTMHISQNIDQSLFPSTLQSVEKGPQYSGLLIVDRVYIYVL